MGQAEGFLATCTLSVEFVLLDTRTESSKVALLHEEHRAEKGRDIALGWRLRMNPVLLITFFQAREPGPRGNPTWHRYLGEAGPG